MSISISTYTRNSLLAKLIADIDSGNGLNTGYIEIRTEPRPDPNQAATGTLLVTANLSNPSFGPVSNGQCLAYEITPRTNILSDGIASWFRIYNRDNIPILDGSVSNADGDGDIKFNTEEFSVEGKIAFTNIRLIFPSLC